MALLVRNEDFMHIIMASDSMDRLNHKVLAARQIKTVQRVTHDMNIEDSTTTVSGQKTKALLKLKISLCLPKAQNI